MKNPVVVDWGSVSCDYTARQTIFHASGESHSNRFRKEIAAQELLNVMIYTVWASCGNSASIPTSEAPVRANTACNWPSSFATKPFGSHDLFPRLVSEGLAMELCGEIFRWQTRDVNRSSIGWARSSSILRERSAEPVFTLADLAGTVSIHSVGLARALHKRFGRCRRQIRKLRTEESLSRVMVFAAAPSPRLPPGQDFPTRAIFPGRLSAIRYVAPRIPRSPQPSIDPRD